MRSRVEEARDALLEGEEPHQVDQRIDPPRLEIELVLVLAAFLDDERAEKADGGRLVTIWLNDVVQEERLVFDLRHDVVAQTRSRAADRRGRHGNRRRPMT